VPAEAIAHGGRSLCPERIPAAATPAPESRDPKDPEILIPPRQLLLLLFLARFCRAMANILPIHQGLALTLTMR